MFFLEEVEVVEVVEKVEFEMFVVEECFEDEL